VDAPFRVAVWGPEHLAARRCQQLGISGFAAAWVGDDARVSVSGLSTDVLLLDSLTGEAALKPLRRLDRIDADLDVVLLIQRYQPAALFEALSLGISGCALGSIDPRALTALLKAVKSGELVVEPCLARRLLHTARQRRRPSMLELSAREEEVLSLVSLGLTNGQIANHLQISRPTVRTHLEHVYQKLEASNRVEAVARAVVEGLL
jgi:DNA-binding NarL/FixJ family response regulator